MVLLAGSGIADLAGASAIASYLIAACPEVWLCLRTRGKGSHFADTVARALDLPLMAVVAEEQSLAPDLLHGIPPGSSAKGVLAAAADLVLAQCVAPRPDACRCRHWSGGRSGLQGPRRAVCRWLWTDLQACVWWPRGGLRSARAAVHFAAPSPRQPSKPLLAAPAPDIRAVVGQGVRSTTSLRSGWRRWRRLDCLSCSYQRRSPGGSQSPGTGSLRRLGAAGALLQDDHPGGPSLQPGDCSRTDSKASCTHRPTGHCDGGHG